MDSLTLFSWNARGLNIPHKRVALLEVLKKEKVGVAMISESHLLEKDSLRIHNKQYHVVAHSAAANKSKGVLIIVKRNLNFTNLGTGGDTEGRITFIKTLINNQKIAFISVYAPNTYDAAFFSQLTQTMLKLDGFQLIVGADFNAVWEHAIDRTSNVEGSDQKHASIALKKWAEDVAVVDLWRTLNPTIKDYSFFSGRHNTFSRIDYIFASKTLFVSIEATMSPLTLSDHKAVICKCKLTNQKIHASKWRFNITLLQDAVFLLELKKALEEFISINKGSGKDPQVLWDIVKGSIKDFCSAYASKLQKIRQKRLVELEQELTFLERTMHSNVTPDLVAQRNELRTEMNSLHKHRAEFLIHRTRQKHYFEGSRPSRSLAISLKASENFANISSIKSQKGKVAVDPDEINSIFRSYYSNLYTSEINFDQIKTDKFFENLHIAGLSSSDALSMEGPVTLDELNLALQSLNKGRSPGVDGIPPELLLAFWPQMGPLLLNMIHQATKVGSFSKLVNQATLTLLLKKDKDPSECSSYRPISLLNADVKLYAKVLALRLEPFMSKLVNPDQTGFIKSRLGADNVRRLLHIIEASSALKSPCAVFSLDAQQAFDRLEHHFLWTVLRRMGFGEQFVHMVQTLYSSPTATVLTGAQRSYAFPITRSSRQGCCLSPLLFALSLEPLAQAVRQSSHSPITVHNTKHHISLYADDILLYLGDAPKSIPIILSIFDQFSDISGYKINWSKSALLPLNSLMSNSTPMTGIPVVKKLKYLGLKIYPSLNAIIKMNYQSLSSKVGSDLERWTNLPISFQARASTIRMNILPRVNYFSTMLPLPPPAGYYEKLDKSISKFIWKGKRPRIKLQTLQGHRESGGQGIPNFKLYAWCFTLRALRTWLDPQAPVAWRLLEEGMVRPHRLQDLIYSDIPLKSCASKFGPIISHLISTFRTIESHTNTHLKFHSYLPLFQNYAIRVEGRPISFPQWKKNGINTISDICTDGEMRLFQDLEGCYGIPGTSFYGWLQLREALKEYGVPWGPSLSLDTHALHKLCTAKNPKGLVANLYSLISKSVEKPSLVNASWSRDLSISPSLINWKTVWKNIKLSSRNPNHQMIHYNYVHRVYCTPRKRFQMKITKSPNCDLCPRGIPGTLLHMLWECSAVQKFWRAVLRRLTVILGIDIPCTPIILLLNDFTELVLTMRQRRWLLLGLTAAKKMIAQRWKPPHILSYQQWVSSTIDLAGLEMSVARMHGAKSENIAIWTLFVEAMRAGV